MSTTRATEVRVSPWRLGSRGEDVETQPTGEEGVLRRTQLLAGSPRNCREDTDEASQCLASQCRVHHTQENSSRVLIFSADQHRHRWHWFDLLVYLFLDNSNDLQKNYKPLSLPSCIHLSKCSLGIYATRPN